MAKKSVKIKAYTNVIEEYVANAAITPGHLIQIMSTDKVRVHASAGQNALPMFALEDELQGKGIDEAYAATDRVQCWVPNRGDVVNAVLKNGETIVIGDFLESAGDGTLQKHIADVDSSNDITWVYPLQIVGQAIVALDLSGSSGADALVGNRIQIRIV